MAMVRLYYRILLIVVVVIFLVGAKGDIEDEARGQQNNNNILEVPIEEGLINKASRNDKHIRTTSRGLRHGRRGFLDGRFPIHQGIIYQPIQQQQRRRRRSYRGTYYRSKGGSDRGYYRQSGKGGKGGGSKSARRGKRGKRGGRDYYDYGITNHYHIDDDDDVVLGGYNGIHGYDITLCVPYPGTAKHRHSSSSSRSSRSDRWHYHRGRDRQLLRSEDRLLKGKSKRGWGARGKGGSKGGGGGGGGGGGRRYRYRGYGPHDLQAHGNGFGYGFEYGPSGLLRPRCPPGFVYYDQLPDADHPIRPSTQLSPSDDPAGQSVRVEDSFLKYAFSDGTTPRAATAEELAGIIEQTNDFFTEVFRNMFGDDFISFNAENNVQTFNGEDAEFPITIDFDADLQFAEGVTPPTEEEIISIMRLADFDLFIEDFARNASPFMSSIFFDTQDVEFDNGNPAEGPSPDEPTDSTPDSPDSGPTPETPQPPPPETTQPPAPEPPGPDPETPQPPAPEPPGPDPAPTPAAGPEPTPAVAEDPQRVTIQDSFLEYGFFPERTPREATPEEIAGVVEQTNLFFTEVFSMAYGADFVSFAAENNVQTFNGEAAEYPITIDFDAAVQFAEGVTPPTSDQVFQTMQDSDLDAFIRNFVWNSAPVMESLFFDTQRVMYDARISSSTTGR